MVETADAITGQEPEAAQTTAPERTTSTNTPNAPTTDGQEPDEDEAYDKERAMATIRKLRQENKAAAAAIKERDTLKAAQQAAIDAQLSKEEQLSKRASQLEAERDFERQTRQDLVNRYEVQIAAGKLGIVDPDAAVKLLDWSSLDYADDGTPKDVDKALKVLLRERPYLAGGTTPPMAATNGPTRASSPGNRIYSKSELSDYAFYSAHRDDIQLAMRQGRVID